MKLDKAWKKYAVIAGGILLLSAILLLLLRSCGGDTAEPVSPEDYLHPLPIGNISDEGPAQRSGDEILADLNRQVAEGMITMSMNPDPVFPDGTLPGSVLIHNDEANLHAQVIRIVREDTGGEIYNSGMIPVGKYINSDKLSVDLDAGEYPCTAYFNSVDESTGAVLGTGAVKVTVHVQN